MIVKHSKSAWYKFSKDISLGAGALVIDELSRSNILCLQPVSTTLSVPRHE